MSAGAIDPRVAGRFQAFASGGIVVALMFAWSFGEATVWPIIADIPLGILAAYTLRPARLVAATVLGMAVGGLLLFGFASANPAVAADLLERLPLVGASQRDRGAELLDERGIGAFAVQPLSGVPFKVLGLQAGIEGASWASVPIFVVARGLRMVATGAVGYLAGRWLRPWLTRRFRVAIAVYLAITAAAWAAVTF